MSMQTIEVDIPEELVAQIDAQVGADHRSQFIADLTQKAFPETRALTWMETKELNERLAKSGSRFRPIFIKGEALSATLLRDRGER